MSKTFNPMGMPVFLNGVGHSLEGDIRDDVTEGGHAGHTFAPLDGLFEIDGFGECQVWYCEDEDWCYALVDGEYKELDWDGPWADYV